LGRKILENSFEQVSGWIWTGTTRQALMWPLESCCKIQRRADPRWVQPTPQVGRPSLTALLPPTAPNRCTRPCLGARPQWL
jgi:hypothetical protein